MQIDILLIDDSVTIQKVIMIAFQGYDVRLHCASSLVDALNKVHQSIPHIILADSGLSGIEQLVDPGAFLDTDQIIPVIILLGSYLGSSENELRDKGFSWLLKKPFESTQIVEIVSQALGQDLPGLDAEQDGRLEPDRQQENILTPEIPGIDFSNEKKVVDYQSASSEDQWSKLHTSDGNDLEPPPPPPPPMIDLSMRQEKDKEIASPEQVKAPEQPPLPEKSTPMPVDPKEHFHPAQNKAFDGNQGFMPIRNDADQSLKGSRVYLEDNSVPSQAQHTDESLENLGASASPKLEELAKEVDLADLASKIDLQPLTDAVLPELQKQLPVVVRRAVEDYCARHFSMLARDILISELRRLAEDKTRHLVDN
tara:strand:+ start:318 stop:1421 length:1104 start_codon:yes stop_codon:yes gene_type:complete